VEGCGAALAAERQSFGGRTVVSAWARLSYDVVRIMAAGPVLADAVADLATLQADAIERTVAEDVLVHLQHRLGKKPSRTPEEEEFIGAMQSTWVKARDQGHHEGRVEGEAAANARAVLTVLQARGVAVPDAVRERVLAQKDLARLELWLARAAVASSVAAVIDEPS
jgi:hypothetical protein